MGKLAPDGYHVAILKNFVMKRTGEIEFHFEIPQHGATVKYKCNQDKAKEVYKMLTEKEVGSLTRELLKKAVGKKIVVGVEIREYDAGGFTIHYNKVIDVAPYDERYEKPEVVSNFDPTDWSMENIMGLK